MINYWLDNSHISLDIILDNKRIPTKCSYIINGSDPTLSSAHAYNVKIAFSVRPLDFRGSPFIVVVNLVLSVTWLGVTGSDCGLVV